MCVERGRQVLKQDLILTCKTYFGLVGIKDTDLFTDVNTDLTQDVINMNCRLIIVEQMSESITSLIVS